MRPSWVWFMCVALVIFPLSVEASEDALPEAGKWGLGVSLGAPTSVTGKYYLSDTLAVDAHLGGFPFFAAGFHGTLFVAADLILDWAELAETEDFRISLYGGAGAMGLFNVGETRVYDDDFEALVPFYRRGVGVRFPGGVSGQLKIAPVEFFVEISPSLAVLFRPRGIRNPAFLQVQLLHIALGARYYF